MYGIYANIWGIFMVNVTIYSIHGSYGYADPKNKAWDALGLRASLHRLLEDFMASCCVVVSFSPHVVYPTKTISKSAYFPMGAM